MRLQPITVLIPAPALLVIPHVAFAGEAKLVRAATAMVANGVRPDITQEAAPSHGLHALLAMAQKNVLTAAEPAVNK